MSIDFTKLPPEEMLLLYAVESMEEQWPSKLIGEKLRNILETYDLLTCNRSSELLRCRIAFVNVNPWLRKREWTRDRTSINKRSDALLCLLAGVSLETMGFSEENSVYLNHGFVSAGEAACDQLRAYGLLLRSRPFGGRMNPSGMKAASLALSDDYQPLSQFTFEDIK